MRKALITGITGFVGSHLADLLKHQGVQVTGTYRRHHDGDESHKNLLAFEISGGGKLVECELQSYASVEAMLWKESPDVIYHLAANSFVPSSWVDPSGVMHNNVQSTLNILNAVKRIKELTDLKYDPVVLMACSSEEYGLVEADELPIRESNPLRPLSPYAVSKVTCEMLCWQYARSYGIRTVITRAFNHEGARRGKDFVISNFAYQIAKAEKEGRKEFDLKVGNLDARRDFTHVKDTVQAYMKLADLKEGEHIPSGEVFNIATGEVHTMHEVVDQLRSMAKLTINVTPDPERMRPSDVPVLQGSYEKLAHYTDWKPTFTFNDILRDTLEYWRENL